MPWFICVAKAYPDHMTPPCVSRKNPLAVQDPQDLLHRTQLPRSLNTMFSQHMWGWAVCTPVFLPLLWQLFRLLWSPGLPCHVCHSIILSGLPGSHYFTAMIIYSWRSPRPICYTYLDIPDRGQGPHSVRINHQPRRQGACGSPRTRVVLQT